MGGAMVAQPRFDEGSFEGSEFLLQLCARSLKLLWQWGRQFLGLFRCPSEELGVL
jgi:hypothetical protein